MHGNGCGHSPDNPRWFEPPPKHTRPKIIEKAIAEIRRYYREPASAIPSLNLANGSDRQQRSERREACLSVLGCLLHYLDLATLRVGIPQNDASFQGISMPFIAQKAGLNPKRAERAIGDLVKAGLITVHPLCEKIADAVYKGYAAIRTISAKFFSLFGLGGRLKYERDKASARLKKKAIRCAAIGCCRQAHRSRSLRLAWLGTIYRRSHFFGITACGCRSINRPSSEKLSVGNWPFLNIRARNPIGWFHRNIGTFMTPLLCLFYTVLSGSQTPVWERRLESSSFHRVNREVRASKIV
ncbi:MAG: hypothetical protein PHH11_04850 [Methylomonas sp.]|nr:hypothetical protein [Methylomonas sp.]